MTAEPRACDVHASGEVDLYFYGELDVETAERVETHLRACGACRHALEELELIREALASRPVIAAPPNDDWSGFMSRLDAAVAQEVVPLRPTVVTFRPRRSYAPLLAMAALLALVTISVLFVARGREAAMPADRTLAGGGVDPVAEPAGLADVGQQHLERSKLVLLGLTSKDPGDASSSDWEYERELASRLLADTRLYRLAAEERGLTSLADILKDLELVLLQTSMAEGKDPADLSRIQRAIRKRDLLQKVSHGSDL